jgi:hypothetical protein
MKGFHAIVLAAGAACLFVLVQRIGLHILWHDALRLGWGAVIIVALAGLEHLLHLTAWRWCFSHGQAPGWARLIAAFLGGYAVGFATPTAMVGGDVSRGALLLGRVPPVEVAASITLDRLVFAAADAMLGLCGVVLIVDAAPLSTEMRAGVGAAGVLMAAGIAAFFELQRRGRLAQFFAQHRLIQRALGARRAAHMMERSAEMDRRLARFHAQRPGALAGALALHAAATLVSAVQIAVFLAWLDLGFSLETVLRVFFVSVALDLFSFFIPFRLGAHEAARMLAMSMAGLNPGLGLLLALVIRVEHLVWAGLGFLAYLAALAHRPVRTSH